ncbi:acetate/propionate family kinase [Pontiella sulfatireligans]|uniref:Acetate kinase n=1 Tax=Pontiella sulfatireligans TaxID=2750658 RepID=A0A6C2UL74_9BACT|nr:acetate/propionate family kinase [Pontiella sulfatireligans]VGO19936.1 Acetate kinase [Pontiella sulfatireligans]
MNRLVLNLEPNALAYGFFPTGKQAPMQQGCIEDIRTDVTISDALKQILSQIESGDCPFPVESVALHVAASGDLFRSHTVATPSIIEKLKSYVPFAPMHMPVVLELIECCSLCLPGRPVALFFETAFFTKLPAREYLYAINPDALAGAGIRRYGYHGLFHEAATRAARASLGEKLNRPAKIVSVCLEPHPEVAAICGTEPVMISGGATPLEGLPGQTSCGEIDSGVLLTLSRKEQWGPEQLNQLLTQQSGMVALAGRPVTIEEVLLSKEADLLLAKQVLEYRILLRAGMALAAMDGFDQIVFSGRYAATGKVLGPWLQERLPSTGKSNQPVWKCYENSLMRIMAEQLDFVLQMNPTPGRAKARAARPCLIKEPTQ